MKKLIIVFIVSITFSQVQAQVEHGNILIKNGTVITITKGTFENTDVLVKDGKVSQIGKNIAAPAGYKVIDATNKFVMPGIIDAHSHIALTGINEYSNAITPEVWTGDELNPFDISIYRALAGGVTVSHALHGSANSMGGQSDTIQHRDVQTSARPDIAHTKHTERPERERQHKKQWQQSECDPTPRAIQPESYRKQRQRGEQLI